MTPFADSAASPSTSWLMEPRRSEPLKSSGGMGSRSAPCALSANPYAKSVPATAPPATGPAMDTSNRSSLFLGRDLICVMLPKDPSWPLGIRKGIEVLIPVAAPAMTWPTSCASAEAKTPPNTGNAPSTYAAESKFSRPGGSSPGAREVSRPCDPAASHWMVAGVGRDTSARVRVGVPTPR